MIHSHLLKFILFALCFALNIGTAHALDVDNVRFGLHSDKVRMVIELDEISEYRTTMLPAKNGEPYRLIVDLPSFNWKAGTIKRPPNTNITDVRSGDLSRDVKRIIVDLDKPAQILKAFNIPASGSKVDRLVIDFKSVTKTAFSKSSSKSFGTLPDTSNLNSLIASQFNEAETIKPENDTLKTLKEIILPSKKPSVIGAKQSEPTPTSPLRKPLIVIDAGHGGKDPGAIGAESQKEKDITLAAARTLKKKLEKTGRYRATLTRDNDKYIKLSRRVGIAREKEADLFISLHADSIGNSKIQGASIYTLSNKASDAQTAKLARRENQSDLIAGVDLSHEDKDVANILLDLAMRDTMNQSKFFANIVVGKMEKKGIRVLPRPHRYAGFAVLKAPDTPSILFEMGFMSNRSEARLLSTSNYRDKIASALIASIDSYFEKVRDNNN